MTSERATCERCGKHFLRDEEWKKVCLSCYIAKKNGGSGNVPFEKRHQVPVGISISKELLGKLIMLCHPDKHSGSKLSTEVTQQLLSLRKNER